MRPICLYKRERERQTKRQRERTETYRVPSEVPDKDSNVKFRKDHKNHNKAFVWNDGPLHRIGLPSNTATPLALFGGSLRKELS